MIFILLVTAIIALFIWLIQLGNKNKNYFNDKNVKFLQPKPFVGNTMEIVFKTKSPANVVQKFFETFPDDDIIGFFDQMNPTYLVKDPELLKQLTIKHFNNFEKHRVVVTKEMDPIIANTLLSLQGDKWREMRSTLSPAFTGNKMKIMFELLLKCTKDLISSHTQLIAQNSQNLIETKNFFTRFTNDIIATCTFGIEINSIKYPTNEFYTMGERLMNFGTTTIAIKIFGFFFVPWIMKIFKVTLLSKSDQNYFRRIILDTIKNREDKSIVRSDMLNLLIKAKQGRLTNIGENEIAKEFSAVDEFKNDNKQIKETLSDDDLVAQCLIFFLAGFDTSTMALSFIAYELALNPDLQQKLINEIDDVNQKLNGKHIDYESLIKIKYLDQFVSESLRKWPPVPITDRNCNKSFSIRYNNIDLNFNQNDNLWIPVYSLHHNSKYYPNPERFDPERFGDERKHEINPLAYLPFGTGPRNCIGSRFALMTVKTIVFNLLLNFTFEVCQKTENKVKFGKRNGRIFPDEGIWLELKPRIK